MDNRWSPEGLSPYADSLRRAGELEIYLDFDGTLVPIQPDPDAVELGAETRRVLGRLSGVPDVSISIISGRALSDLRDRVGVDGIDYAGNHGFELEVGNDRWLHPGVKEVRPQLEAVAERLEIEFASVSGVRVEDKSATLTLHYRSAPADAVSEVRQTARRIVSKVKKLRTEPGKAVVQIRPALDWDKGDAIRVLSSAGEDTLTMYAGDDQTDTDGFSGLEDLPGSTLAVGVGEKSLAADVNLSGPTEVQTMLEWILDLRSEQDTAIGE